MTHTVRKNMIAYLKQQKNEQTGTYLHMTGFRIDEYSLTQLLTEHLADIHITPVHEENTTTLVLQIIPAAGVYRKAGEHHELYSLIIANDYFGDLRQTILLEKANTWLEQALTEKTMITILPVFQNVSAAHCA